MSSKMFSAGTAVSTINGLTGDFKGLYVGTGGHVAVSFRGGESGHNDTDSNVTFHNVPSGTFMDIAVTRVGSTQEGTHALGIVGLH